jgi:hypothetical protein
MQRQVLNRPIPTNIPQNKTPPEIFDDYCRRVITRGNYLDSQEIAHELISTLAKIKFLPLFHHIQSSNRFVDTPLDVYWHTNSLRVLFEGEEFILRFFHKWSRSNHRTFEGEIGVGSLGRHPKIVKLSFEFFGNPFREDLLPKFSMEESLIRVTAIFIDRLGGGKGPEISFELTENTQESSQKVPFERCRVECAEDKCHLAISDDLKEISHKILATKSIEIQEICSRRGYWPNDERTLSASPALSVSRDMMLIPTSLFVRLNGFDPLTSPRLEGSDFCLRAQAQAHVTTISSGAAIGVLLLAHCTTPDYTSKLLSPLKMSKYELEALREYSLRWREVERQTKAANSLTSAKLTWVIHCDGSQGLEAATILQTLCQ